MEDTSRPQPGEPTPWSYQIGQDHLAQPAVLLVEDDRDIRDMIATLLGMAGFTVVPCDSAECGLTALREQAFDLVLTDYALPRKSGLWLLEEAEAEGLIQGTPVLIVTAHPNVDAETDYEVIYKPFDLDDLVDRVRRRLGGTDGGPRRKPPTAPGRNGSGTNRNPECPGPVELILYVNSQSPRSHAAVHNLEQVLDRFHSSRVKLTVCDLAANPNGGIEDSGAFTPTLVRRTPGPRTFILGHVTNPELLLELLADCESDRN